MCEPTSEVSLAIIQVILHSMLIIINPVAYKRIADNVPTAIDRELVRGAAKDTLQILYENLGIDGVDGERICRDYASESSEVAARRADLQKKLERLQTASEELLAIRI
jgi:hypothetical protein